MCLNESKCDAHDVKHIKKKKKKEKSGEGKDLVLCDLIQYEAFIPACAIKMWLAGSADVVLLFPAISCY